MDRPRVNVKVERGNAFVLKLKLKKFFLKKNIGFLSNLLNTGSV